MIKLEHVVLASPEQMDFIIEGMRNPMNSWEKSDSGNGCDFHLCSDPCVFSPEWCGDTPKYILGENDHSLMQCLSSDGTDHRKFMRMMPVYVRITAPLYWWKEFDTYKVGTVANSCSTMHKIAEKEFTLDDFSTEHLDTGYKDSPVRLDDSIGVLAAEECDYYMFPKDILTATIDGLNRYREKYLETKKQDCWWQMIQLLPSSYNQTRNVMLNYEVLVNIYKSRKDHKLDEWREFCKWIEILPYSELIVGGGKKDEMQ